MRVKMWVQGVQEGAPTAAGGEELAEEGGVDDADCGEGVVDEADGDAEHGEEVDVVDGAWRRVINV